MESKNHTADVALESWNELYSALKGAARERNLEFRRPEEFSLLIQNKKRRGYLRVWFLPELKKLRYNAAMETSCFGSLKSHTLMVSVGEPGFC